MNSRKLIFAAAFVFAAAFIHGKTKTSYVQTEHFDIIFEEEAKESASSIYSVAEKFLDELCSTYNVKPQFRIPVYITAKSQSFNGYFTNYNYNHIVIFDAVPEENLYTNMNNMESTFLHELTHLVTVNVRNKFWTAFDKIAGDIYNPGYYLNMTTFVCEGASVFEESKNGDGRLNDGFFMHAIKQAKADGKFPSYSDVFGSRNIYPAGKASYEFGSAFTKFIIEKYGMEKYAEFWYKGINFHRPTVPWVFKKTYGVSLKDEWKNFYDSIDVSDIKKIAEEESNSGFSNRELHRFAASGSYENKILVTDEATGSVFLCTVENGKISSSKKIFTISNLSSAKLCADGRFICTKEISSNYPSKKNTAGIYDIENKKWHKIKQTGIYESCAILIDGKPYVLCIKSSSQKLWFELMSLDGKKTFGKKIEFKIGQIPFDLNSDGDGNVYFLLKDQLKFSLCKMKFTGGQIPQNYETVELEGIRARNLNVAKDSLGKTRVLFSFAKNEMIPSLASGEFEDGKIKMKLLEENLSGGIYTPVFAGGEVFYSANSYDEKRIQKLSFENPDAKEFILSFEVKNFGDENSDSENYEFKSIAFSESDIKPYRKLFYPGQSLVPLSLLQSYYISPSVYYTDEDDCLGSGGIYVLGLTAVKNNPADTRHLILTAGFNPVKKAGGFGATFMGKTQSEFLNFTNAFSSIFNSDGFMQLSNDLTISVEFQTGKLSHVVLSDSNFTFFGKNDMDEKRKDELDFTEAMLSKNNFYIKNNASITYTNIHSTGIKANEKLGFSIAMNYKNVAAFCTDDRKNSIFLGFRNVDDDVMHYQTLYPSATVRLPKLLPFECRGYFTYNLPLILNGSLFATNNNFTTYSAETVLFSWEIQKGFGPVPLFASNITLSALYRGELVQFGNRAMEIFHLGDDLKNVKYMQRNDYAGIKILSRLSFNSGALANSGTYLNLGYTLLYGVTDSTRGKIRGGMILSLSTGLF